MSGNGREVAVGYWVLAVGSVPQEWKYDQVMAVGFWALAVGSVPKTGSLTRHQVYVQKSVRFSGGQTLVHHHGKHLVLGMRNFRELRIWQEGMSLVVDIYRVANQLPKQEDYGMKSQVKRAAVSILANIAEGCSRSSQKEFKHFLEISLGSTFEVETDLLVAEKLEFIATDHLSNLLSNIQTLQRQINALISKLK